MERKDAKQDTKHMESVISEIEDLKARAEKISIEINKIKEILKIPSSV